MKIEGAVTAMISEYPFKLNVGESFFALPTQQFSPKCSILKSLNSFFLKLSSMALGEPFDKHLLISKDGPC